MQVANVRKCIEILDKKNIMILQMKNLAWTKNQKGEKLCQTKNMKQES